MEQEDEAQCLEKPRTSTYPDLDYTPNFPWLGQSSARYDFHHADANPEDEEPTVHPSFASQDPDCLAAAVSGSSSETERFETRLAELKVPASKTDVVGNNQYITGEDPKDVFLDPDFHFEDDSNMYASFIVRQSSS